MNINSTPQHREEFGKLLIRSDNSSHTGVALKGAVSHRFNLIFNFNSSQKISSCLAPDIDHISPLYWHSVQS